MNHMNKFYTTEQMAVSLCMRPQSIRKRYNKTGSYYGIVPTKLPNKRLFWLIQAVEALKQALEH